MSKAEKILNHIVKRLGKGYIKISRKGVPHIVLGKYSITYFGARKFLRVHVNYMNTDNKKLKDFKEFHHVVNFFKNEIGLENIGFNINLIKYNLGI